MRHATGSVRVLAIYGLAHGEKVKPQAPIAAKSLAVLKPAGISRPRRAVTETPDHASQIASHAAVADGRAASDHPTWAMPIRGRVG